MTCSTAFLLSTCVVYVSDVCVRACVRACVHVCVCVGGGGEEEGGGERKRERNGTLPSND